MAYLTLVFRLPEGEKEKEVVKMLQDNIDEKGLICSAALEMLSVDDIDPLALLNVLADIAPDALYAQVYEELLKDAAAQESMEEPNRKAIIETMFKGLLADGSLFDNLDKITQEAPETQESAETSSPSLILPPTSIVLH